MSTITDFKPITADETKDDAVLYLVQDREDLKISIAELKNRLKPEPPPIQLEIVNINW